MRLDVLSMAFTGLVLAYATCFLTSSSAPTSAVDRNAAGDPIASVDGGTVGWPITAIIGGAIDWPVVAAAITIPRIAVAGVAVGRIAVAITRVPFGTVRAGDISLRNALRESLEGLALVACFSKRLQECREIACGGPGRPAGIPKMWPGFQRSSRCRR